MVGLLVVGLLPVVWFLTDCVVFTICLPILSPRLLRPSLNDWASALGMLTRNAVHRIRMFLAFICNDYRSSKFTNESSNLRKKSELLYYNDENLMFASLASNRRQTAFRLRADLLDRLDAVFDEPNDETLAAMKEADNLTKVDMSNYESFLKSLE